MGTRGRRGAIGAVLVAVVVVVALVGRGGASDPAATPAASTTTSASTSTSARPVATTAAQPPEPGSVTGLLATLRVRTADPAADYRRAEFGDDWDYDPVSGCNTRERVLIDEAVVEPTVDDRCRSTDGRWVSLYDGVPVDDVADLQIDHLVPLADAWRSGAATWTPERRRAFANDRTSPDTLIAVTGHTNQSKGDSTPDEWLPPDEAAWCTYAAMWVRVKAAWDLSVTMPERDRLAQLLAAC
jgi:hypothetical protein